MITPSARITLATVAKALWLTAGLVLCVTGLYLTIGGVAFSFGIRRGDGLPYGAFGVVCLVAGGVMMRSWWKR